MSALAKRQVGWAAVIDISIEQAFINEELCHAAVACC